MATVAAAATLRRTSGPGVGPVSQVHQAGTGCASRTESSTIFRGHGEASVMMVSTTMAKATMASHRQYGRTRRREKSSTDHRGPAAPGSLSPNVQAALLSLFSCFFLPL